MAPLIYNDPPLLCKELGQINMQDYKLKLGASTAKALWGNIRGYGFPSLLYQKLGLRLLLQIGNVGNVKFMSSQYDVNDMMLI